MIDKIKSVVFFLKGYWIANTGKRYTVNQIKNRHEKNFKEIANYLSRKSPFYCWYRNKALEEFPIIDKQLFLRHFDAINTVGLTREACEKHGLTAEGCRNFRAKINGVSVGLSSGTSQQRGVFLVSPQEQGLWAGYIVAKNIAFRFKRRKVALFLRANSNLYESANGLLIRFAFFDLTRNFSDLMEELYRYQPDILIAPAQVLGMIAKHQPAIRPAKIISVAEVLEDHTRQAVEQQFACRVDEIYQATEGYIASTCVAGHLHLNEDILIVEKDWVDQHSGRFVPIITDLHRRALPIIRYRLDDILIENQTPCACGSRFTRIEKIEGRVDDMLWLVEAETNRLKGIFPDLVRRAMYVCQHHFTDYRIEQNDNTILVAFESEDVDKAKKEIKNGLVTLFKSLNVDNPHLVFNAGVNHTMTNKLRRIICHKKPNYLG